MSDVASQDGPGGPSAQPVAPQGRRPRRRALVVAAVVVALLAVAAGVALATGGSGIGGGSAAPEPQVVVLPSPTPTVAPVARPPLTPFADALPASVLDHALTSLSEEPPLLVAGALEGYRLVYSDGAAGTVTVLAGQWPTPEAAEAALGTLTAGATPLDDGGSTSGEVVADGVTTGTWVLAAGPDELATLTWRNGTAVLQAVAPPGTVRDVYAAFGL